MNDQDNVYGISINYLKTKMKISILACDNSDIQPWQNWAAWKRAMNELKEDTSWLPDPIDEIDWDNG